MVITWHMFDFSMRWIGEAYRSGEFLYYCILQDLCWRTIMYWKKKFLNTFFAILYRQWEKPLLENSQRYEYLQEDENSHANKIKLLGKNVGRPCHFWGSLHLANHSKLPLWVKWKFISISKSNYLNIVNNMNLMNWVW